VRDCLQIVASCSRCPPGVRSAAGWCLRCCSSWSHHGKLSTATPQPTYRFGLYGFQSPPIYTRPSPVRHEGGLRVRRWAASEVEDAVDHPRCDRRLGPLRRRSGLARAGGRSQRVPHGRGPATDGQGSALKAAICCGMSASPPKSGRKADVPGGPPAAASSWKLKATPSKSALAFAPGLDPSQPPSARADQLVGAFRWRVSDHVTPPTTITPIHGAMDTVNATTNVS